MGAWRKTAAFLAVTFVIPYLATGQFWDGSAMAAEIKKLRGSKIVLYGDPKGKKVKTISAKEIALPLAILSDGAVNGRYQVELSGRKFWITKAQVKETDAKNSKITAKCQDIAKAHASSRGLGNCN